MQYKSSSYLPHDDGRNDDNYRPEGISHDVEEDASHVHVASTVGVTMRFARSEHNHKILGKRKESIKFITFKALVYLSVFK